MNFLYFSFILSVFFLSANQVFSVGYRDIIITEKVYSDVTEEHISEAKLLEWYIVRYRENLYLRFDTLWLLESRNAIWAFQLLDLMSERITQLQAGYIKWSESEELIKSIVTDLKNLNTAIKIYTNKEEEEIQFLLQKKQEQYIIFSQNFSSAIDNFIGKVTKVLIKKETLSENQKDIVRILVMIRNENQTIKNFKSQRFSTEEEMKAYLRGSINKIQSHFQALKEINS